MLPIPLIAITDTFREWLDATNWIIVELDLDGAAYIATIANITPAESTFLVGNGTGWVGETGATARTSLGLGPLATQSFANQTEVDTGTVADKAVAPNTLAVRLNSIVVNDASFTGQLSVGKGGTGASTASDARTNLGLGSVAVENTTPIAKGGTAATDAATARNNLGLGSVAIEDTTPIAKGGTGATTATTARTNLGLGTIAIENTAPVSKGGTGATDAATARTNLGIGSIGTQSAGAVTITGGTVTGLNTLTQLDLGGTPQQPLLEGRHSFFVPASAMISNLTGGAAPGQIETGTSTLNVKTLDFDAAVNEFAQFVLVLPKTWDRGTITSKFIWTASAGTAAQGIRWAVKALCINDDGGLGSSWTGVTAVEVTDNLLATLDVHISAETSAMTVGGTITVGSPIFFMINRAATNAADTLAADGRLIGVQFFMNLDAGNES